VRVNAPEDYVDLWGLEAGLSYLPGPDAAGALNLDQNRRPQNEPAVAVNPSDNSKYVGSANDYNLGAPIGTGTYAHIAGSATQLGPQFVVTGFPPSSLLTGTGPSSPLASPYRFLIEVPFGTGDPSLAYGKSRVLPGRPPVVYLASLGFSFSFCENGVFVYASYNNGLTWTRPIPPGLGGPRYVVVYEDNALNCSVFHDKEWITVDNTGGPHDGRVYATWTRFEFGNGVYKRSPIMLAWSDDDGQTWKGPFEISGFSPQLCPEQVTGPPGACDEDQFSVPVVASDGTLYVQFFNQQAKGAAAQGFRDQILVVHVDPDKLEQGMAGAIEGPYRAVFPVYDGLNDYPIQAAGTGSRQTLCNSNFRVNSAGNLAIGPAGTGGAPPNVQPLYIVFSDNRQHKDEFPFPTRVVQTSGAPRPAFECPAGKQTNVDIFLVKSIDGGKTWTEPIRVNQDAKGNNVDQWFPWVTVDSSGAVYVIYYDRRDSANFLQGKRANGIVTSTLISRPNHLAEVFLAKSTDGGQSWTESLLSQTPSNLDDAFFGRGVFIGDYINVAVSGGLVYGLWTGVAASVSGNVFKSLRTDSDIFIFVGPA